MKSMIHFNNAGAALMPEAAIRAMREFQLREHSQGGYEAAEAQGQTHDNFKAIAAKFIGATTEDIAEMPNATAAWQRPFAAIPFETGDRIITHELEYGANYLSILTAAKRFGVVVDIVRSSDMGVIDLDHLRELITPRTRLISVTHVSAHSGVVQPAEQIGALTREHNILYFLDSSQAIGQIPIDVKDIGCDVMSATGRKFLRGPRGTGFLYARAEFCQSYPPSIAEIQSAFINDKGEAEFFHGARCYENWETNISARIGLTTAMEYALNIGMERIARDIGHLSGFAENLISETTRFKFVPKGLRKSAILALELDVPAKLARNYLRKNSINVSIISPSAAPLRLGKRPDLSAIRMSLHAYNREDEIRKFAQILSGMPTNFE